jgi:hypothetical protein
MDEAADGKRQLNGLVSWLLRRDRGVTCVWHVYNPLRAATMEMSDDTTALLALKSVGLHFKDT